MLALVEHVIAHGIYSALVESSRGDVIEKQVRQIAHMGKRVDELIGTIVANLAKTKLLNTESRKNDLRVYLVSPEVEAIVRQLLGLSEVFVDAKKVTEEAKRAKGDARKASEEQFHWGISAALREAPELTKDLAHQLFHALAIACDEVLSRAVEQNVLAAHDVRSLQRHRMVMQELQSIHVKLDRMASLKMADSRSSFT